ncbi:MAG: hypothetical protein JMJ93_09590 [Synergistaceae bacterium]|nr:hypothetical protein [Synergistaceae bacterium]
MTWINDTLHLEAKLEGRLLPLPKLLAGLEMLTIPTERLEETLHKMLDANPFGRIMPPEEVRDGWDDFLEAPQTMDSHLFPQLATCPALKDAAPGTSEKLLECLDGRGYLNVALNELALCLDSNLQRTEFLLRALQDWVDPPGFFARDLVDCLAIQLRRKGKENGEAWRLLQEGRTLLERGRMSDIPQALGMTPKELARALEDLRLLDPQPGRAFEPKHPVVPEILFRADGGEITTVLLEKNLPRIVAERDLLAWVDEASLHPAWRQFRETLALLARRYRTKLRLARFLASRQKSHLVLDETATALGCHLSTVHRTARSTWALAPTGTICLSRLFSRPLQARPDLSVAALESALSRGRQEGKSFAAVARELGIPRRTAAWHGRKLGKIGGREKVTRHRD